MTNHSDVDDDITSPKFGLKQMIFVLLVIALEKLALVLAYHKTWAMLSQFGKPLNWQKLFFKINFNMKSECKHVYSSQFSSFIWKAHISFAVFVLALFIIIIYLFFYFKKIYCILENLA